MSEDQDERPEKRPPVVVLGSILESLRAAASARERSELVRESLHELARTIIAVVLFAVLLCIAITELLVGVIKVNSCPINRYIPIWLIVSGATSFVRNISGIFFSIWESKRGKLVHEFFTAIFATFWLVWLILGSYWTYSIYDEVVYDERNQSYCDQVAYRFAFVIITLTYAVIAILLCCCFYCIVCLCCHNSAVLLIS